MPPDSPMGFAAMPAFIARDGTIDTSTKALLLILSSFAGADQSCYPSNAMLCECAGLSESTVRRLLRDAETRGLVVTMRRTALNGAPLSNLYRLNFAKWGGKASDSDTRSNLQGGGVMGAPRVGAPVEGGWAHPRAPNKTSEQDQGTEPSFALASEPPSKSKPSKPKPKSKPKPEPPGPPTIEATQAIIAAMLAEDERSTDDAREIATKCWKWYRDRDWRDKHNKPVDFRFWKSRCRTWYGNWSDSHPAPGTHKLKSAFSATERTQEECDRLNEAEDRRWAELEAEREEASGRRAVRGSDKGDEAAARGELPLGGWSR